jgi:hypothetical protein
MGEALKYLYDKFVIRDLLSFVTPGAIVLWAVLYFYNRELLNTHTHWLIYIPIFGLIYVIGFAIQCFGEILDLVITQRLMPSSRYQRWGFFLCDWRNKADALQWWRKLYRTIITQNITIKRQDKEVREWASQDIERLVVLKQMCGNNFCAFILAAIAIGISYIPIFELKISLLCLLIGLPLLASLFWGHRVHVLRHNDRAAEIQRQLNKIDTKK